MPDARGRATGINSRAVRPNHSPQEEDIVSSWLHAVAPNNPSDQNRLFHSTIAGKWGLLRGGNTCDPNTIQVRACACSCCLDKVHPPSPRPHCHTLYNSVLHQGA